MNLEMKSSKLRWPLFLIALFCFAWSAQAMVNDNRWLPVIWKPFITSPDRPSNIRLGFFAVSAKRSYDQHKDEIPLPAIYGQYDQGKLAEAFVKLGYPNPLKPEWRGAEIPWIIQGKFQGQGCTFQYHQALTDWFSFGLTTFFLHLDSWNEFFLEQDKLTLRLQPGDMLELAETRRSMHRDLGLCGDYWHHNGIGDIDFYIRFNHRWQYSYKFRTVDAGIRIGALAPSAKKRNINYPTAIPFGGDGRLGIYGAIDAEFELREDWKAGFFLWASKRASSCQDERVSVNCEPLPYGALCENVDISPGITILASPYISFENLRDGFGVRAQYTLRAHRKDTWRCLGPFWPKGNDRCTKGDLASACNVSNWGSDYFSVSAFYDFRRLRLDNNPWLPILTLNWDIPAGALFADKSAKTQQVSLSIEWNY